MYLKNKHQVRLFNTELSNTLEKIGVNLFLQAGLMPRICICKQAIPTFDRGFKVTFIEKTHRYC